MTNVSRLVTLVGSNPPGVKAEVLVSRDGEEHSFEVTLDALELDLGMAERWLNITPGGQTVAELAGCKGGYRLGSRRSSVRLLTG